MRPQTALDLFNDQLLPSFTRERDRLDRIDSWYQWANEDVAVPQGATKEHRELVHLAKTPWLRLVVDTLAQALTVDGYRSPDGGDMKAPWRTWFANSMQVRQNALHRAGLAYGYSYTKVLPGFRLGEPTAIIRGVDPRNGHAFYRDPANDEFPEFFVELDGDLGYLIDSEFVHSFGFEDGLWRFLEADPHGVGATPVVRYANKLDLRGQSSGEVEPFIGVASRINKTTYDRLLTQHFNSWKVRTVAGLQRPGESDGLTEEEAQRARDEMRMHLRQDDLLIAEDEDTKFGTLDETPLSGFIEAHESDIDSLSAVSQTPRHTFGKMANLSAEALAGARAPLMQKIAERQSAFGTAHGQTLRLAAHIEGDEESASDVLAQVTWQDMEVRSLSQTADALGKLAQTLSVPYEALWSRIPGVTKSDVDEWLALAETSRPGGEQELDPVTTPGG